MTKTQRTYAMAKAAYDTACAEVDKLTANIDVDDPSFEAACESACEQYRPSELFRLMIAAERAMVAECYKLVKSDPKTSAKFAANQKDLDNLFTNYEKFPKVHEQLVDCCFRLAA